MLVPLAGVHQGCPFSDQEDGGESGCLPFGMSDGRHATPDVVSIEQVPLVVKPDHKPRVMYI